MFPARYQFWPVLRCISALLIASLSSWCANANSLEHGRKESGELFSNGQNFALIVGVDKYDYLSPLNYAANDAHGLAQHFRKSGYDDVKTLVNTEATRERILNRLSLLAELAASEEGEGGSIVFAFSGHGFRDDQSNFLATVDTDPDNVTGTALRLSDITDFLRNANVRQRVLL